MRAVSTSGTCTVGPCSGSVTVSTSRIFEHHGEVQGQLALPVQERAKLKKSPFGNDAKLRLHVLDAHDERALRRVGDQGRLGIEERDLGGLKDVGA